ncbi:MAG TPA: DUF1707 and DUF4190 domain-containing protein [Streptosporangiaceae bacterium]|nr:DUF1707 and DUF4190 domain-containing protein [Streptosporangiaceae bacterium]
MTDNQSQWPAQYPRYSQPDGTQVPQDGYQVPAAGYQVPPGAYQIPGAYPVPPGGYPVPPGSYPVQPGYQVRAQASMRASSADRERAVDVLKAGFAEGRLAQDEYNDRMGRAYAARTYGELAMLTADLPAGASPLPAWPVPAYQPAASGTNSMAIASMVLGVAEFFTAGLTAIPAVVCGHIARRQMKLTSQRGDGLATSGLVLGYMAIIFWSVLIAASLVGVAISIAHNGQNFPGGPGGGP